MRASLAGLGAVRRPALVALASVALIEMAVGTTAAVVKGRADSGPPSDPRKAAVNALADRPSDRAGSARYIIRTLQEAPGRQREALVYEGVADFQRQRYRARAVGRDADGDVPRRFDSFVFSEWEYQRRPPGSWERRFFDPSELGSPLPDLAVVGRLGEHLSGPVYAFDRTVRRQIVDALVTDVRLVGEESQHGSKVWHYAVTLDESRSARLPEDIRSEMKSYEEGRSRTVDLWLDGKGRTRKLSILYDIAEGSGFRIDNEFWDYGGPGRLDLPDDLGDPTAMGGEGVSDFEISPGPEIVTGNAAFHLWVFDGDDPRFPVELIVHDRPALGDDSRRHTVSLLPAGGRPLRTGEYRAGDVRSVTVPAVNTFDISGPGIDARCPRGRPRSGTLSLSELASYEGRYVVRLHLRFRISCTVPDAPAPVTFEGEARFHALT